MLTRKLGRKRPHRNHMLRNLAASVILYEKVETTEAKAKEVKSVVDKTITTAKKNSLASRRQLESYFFDSNVVKKLFEVLNERYADRQSGYTRILKLGNRVGDNAEKVVLTLIPGEAAKATEAPKAKKAAKTAKTEAETTPVTPKETNDAK